MTSFTIYNLEGKSVGDLEVPALFQTPVDEKLIHRYFVWVRSMLRPTLSDTKTRGEVSGGGRKPWKQKGTGRARVGSSRSPIWRKGGVVFGPLKEQNWATRMPRGERRKAFFSALSSKALTDQIRVLEDWKIEIPKTKEAVAVQNTIPGLAGKKVLHVSAGVDAGIFGSTKNIKHFDSVTVQNLNIIDVLNHDYILITKDSLAALVDHFTLTI